MTRWPLGLLLVAHGLVHLAIWLPPQGADAPFDVQSSPFFGDVRSVAVVLAIAAGAAFVAAGVGYLAGLSWWPWVTVAAAAVSIALMLLTFSLWWLIGLGIDVAVGLRARRTISGRA